MSSGALQADGLQLGVSLPEVGAALLTGGVPTGTREPAEGQQLPATGSLYPAHSKSTQDYSQSQMKLDS